MVAGVAKTPKERDSCEDLSGSSGEQSDATSATTASLKSTHSLPLDERRVLGSICIYPSEAQKTLAYHYFACA